jgi:hypothetical protein
MADWQIEWNLAKILASARRLDGQLRADATLPPYLTRRQHELAAEGSGR